MEYRCTECRKLLFKGILVDSVVEAKCRGCGVMNTFTGIAKERLLCLKPECVRRVTATSVDATA